MTRRLGPRPDVREPNPQEAQRDGQSAISQGSPLKELHQEGDANSDRPVGSPLATPELTDEEVSVLCDIERDGSAKPDKRPIFKGLVERGFIVPKSLRRGHLSLSFLIPKNSPPTRSLRFPQ